ncbi:zinc finger protein ZAT3-like [Phalaenopsis equestris]|uniref:zinc finger protein ZAT3-like n=1 Tax=Phalaenopsis equestris TaxID=78828 RepID=UPI0009E1C23A|nr:zinc finger protein ZAT3-like [Phalaenopsis equestris]
MNPSSNSPGSNRHGKRPKISSSSSSSSSESSSFSSIDRTRYAAATATDVATTMTAVAVEEEGQKSLAMQADCYVCGRQFGNWKALFGHMRCHPEREWRGVRPSAEGEEGSRGRRKWRRRTGEETTEAAAATTGEYACGECLRVFGTRQALGGHRASHRGVMGCSAKAKETTTGTGAAAAAELRGVRGDGRTFVCPLCGRQFATYHGMRVHQRVHRRQHGETALSGREERGFMVDLNLPPPPEAEEEEVKDVGNY